MNCTRPNLAYRDHNGDIKFLNREKWSIYDAEKAFGKDNVLLLKCGKCPSCILSKRKEYAVRCAMEARYYESNCFITLTYDDFNNPGYLRKRDLTYFIKKLRNKGYKVRYFGCGEYGSLTHRPHYHVILFGFSPEDKKLFSKSETGNPLFISDLVSELWSFGFATVQNFSPEVASYVAGYVNKKVGNDDGFLVMSKKPGLGYQYMFDHRDIIAEYDNICDDFGTIKKAHSPRYFDKICEKLGIDLTYSKEKRFEACSLATQGEMLFNSCDRENLFKKNEVEAKRKLEKLRRKL